MSYDRYDALHQIVYRTIIEGVIHVNAARQMT